MTAIHFVQIGASFKTWNQVLVSFGFAIEPHGRLPLSAFYVAAGNTSRLAVATGWRIVGSGRLVCLAIGALFCCTGTAVNMCHAVGIEELQ